MSSYREEANASSPIGKLPTTKEGWNSLYTWLEKAYNFDSYSDGDLQSMHLFRALDDNEETIHATSRMMTDIRHIVDIDIQALSGGDKISLGATLAAPEGALEAGAKVWRRSAIHERSEDFARSCCALGDMYLYAFLDENRNARIADYDPNLVHVEYDVQDGSRIQRALIEMDYQPNEIQKSGYVVTGDMRQLVRYIDAKEIHTTVDGKTVDEESGPHGLGMVPLVHVPFSRVIGQPHHGLHAAHQYINAAAMVDSILAQTHASGNRYADPMILVHGFSVSGLVKKFGRFFDNLHKEDKVEYLDGPMQGIGTMLTALDKLRGIIREAPEFLFTEAGANASGTALNFKATAFVKKMSGPMLRYRRALATITEAAVCLENSAPCDTDVDILTVELGPALPVAKSLEVQTLINLKKAGGISTADFVRHMQRFDYVPDDIPPEEYVLAMNAETKGFMASFGGLGGLASGDEDEEIDEEIDEDIADETEA